MKNNVIFILQSEKYLIIGTLHAPLLSNMCLGILENTKHIIFECVNIQNIRKSLRAAIRFDIQ